MLESWREVLEAWKERAYAADDGKLRSEGTPKARQWNADYRTMIAANDVIKRWSER